MRARAGTANGAPPTPPPRFKPKGQEKKRENPKMSGGMEIDHQMRSPPRAPAVLEHASLAECHSSLKTLQDANYLQVTTNRYQAKVNRDLRMKVKLLSAKVEDLEARNREERERSQRLEGKMEEILSFLYPNYCSQQKDWKCVALRLSFASFVFCEYRLLSLSSPTTSHTPEATR